ncbi:hypothetical protein QAD02_008320 [Eretmocerus hayati]|uniref:Uncharacterized protein n=1 Tax=Eretmocerus hayati TaxID=131215 RepID=A0ACC2N6R4_9HYME|nr:hypothetical protein QAD02_008320 [Eretmocerus hayati]
MTPGKILGAYKISEDVESVHQSTIIHHEEKCKTSISVNQLPSDRGAEQILKDDPNGTKFIDQQDCSTNDDLLVLDGPISGNIDSMLLAHSYLSEDEESNATSRSAGPPKSFVSVAKNTLGKTDIQHEPKDSLSLQSQLPTKLKKDKVALSSPIAIRPSAVDVTEYIVCHEKKRNNDYVVVKADCKHSQCTSFKFISTTPIRYPYQDIQLQTVQTKQIFHVEGEAHRRFYKEPVRKHWMDQLEKQPTAFVKYIAAKDTPDDVLENGNLNHTPSSVILHRIKSDSRAKEDLDEDYYLFMEQLRKRFVYEYQKMYPDTTLKIPGFIQHHCANPLLIILTSELQIRYVAQGDKLRSNFDATGSIEGDPAVCDEKMTIYHYSIFSPGGKDIAPLEVAEAIMSQHFVEFVQFSLSIFLRCFRLISTRHIEKFEIDGSTVFIYSLCLVLNKMTPKRYMDDLFGEIENEMVVDEPLTIIHVCLSHPIKSAGTKIKKFFSQTSLLKVSSAWWRIG